MERKVKKLFRHVFFLLSQKDTVSVGVLKQVAEACSKVSVFFFQECEEDVPAHRDLKKENIGYFKMSFFFLWLDFY